MSAPPDESYFQWLYEQVADPEFQDKTLTYWKVLRILYTKEFVRLIPNDENRIDEGKALRLRFLESQGISEVDQDWMDMGCSVLELMVSISLELEFQAEKGKAYYWFWELMRNIGLAGFNDKSFRTKRQKDRINDILDDLVYRNYEPNGTGGFFPLRYPDKDQRRVELWYQMGDYVTEHHLAG